MIGYIEGTVQQISLHALIVNVHGLGYEVVTTTNILKRSSNGDNVAFWISTVVREDSITLYGFESNADKHLFLKLISVSGIGPKTALTIVDTYEAKEIGKMLLERDVNKLTKIPGIGKKSAQRLILELENQLTDDKPTNTQEIKNNKTLTDALLQFGYSNNEISSIITEIDTSKPLNAQLKQSLQLLAT